MSTSDVPQASTADVVVDTPPTTMVELVVRLSDLQTILTALTTSLSAASTNAEDYTSDDEARQQARTLRRTLSEFAQNLQRVITAGGAPPLTLPVKSPLTERETANIAANGSILLDHTADAVLVQMHDPKPRDLRYTNPLPFGVLFREQKHLRLLSAYGTLAEAAQAFDKVKARNG